MMDTSSASFESSFKEFLARPENQPILVRAASDPAFLRSLIRPRPTSLAMDHSTRCTFQERHQRKEVKQSIKLQEKMQALKFRSTVLDADLDAQKNIAPFLKNKVLKRIIMTFMNDPNGDFEKWAKNPRVIEMLATAQRMMEDGRLEERDMEEHLIRMLKDPGSTHHDEYKQATEMKARLPTDQLVQALNEHLQERNKGNVAYRKQAYDTALHHYLRAKSIVDLVEGLSTADQEEVVVNAVAVNCNLAAVYLALREFGAAVAAADDALVLDGGCEKALVRKAKALVGQHEYVSAEEVMEELRRVGALDGVEEVVTLMKVSKGRAAQSQRGFMQGLARGL